MAAHDPGRLIACAAAALVAAGLASCSGERTHGAAAAQAPARMDDRCAASAENGTCALYDVSLVELIARPERFNGRAVRVIGFANLEFEGNAIYLSREDWRHAITRNGLWVDPPDTLRNFKPGYVLLEGTFDAANHGHLDLFSGAIEHITRFERWDLTSDPPPVIVSDRDP